MLSVVGPKSQNKESILLIPKIKKSNIFEIMFKAIYYVLLIV